MRDRALDLLLSEPRRLVLLGHAFIRTGNFLLVTGVVGWAATSVISVVTGMATRERPEVALAEVRAGLPIWWVPETPAGYSIALCCSAVGGWAIHVGRVYHRAAVLTSATQTKTHATHSLPRTWRSPGLAFLQR